MKNNNIIIIGANSDIAKEISKKYLKNNCFLYLFTRNKKDLENYESGIFLNDKIEIIEYDYSDVDYFIKKLESLQNKPNIALIANGYLGNNKIYSKDEFNKIFEINHFIPVKYSEVIISYFIKNNIKGILAVFASVAGLRGRSKNYIYGSAKSALITYLSGLRQKYSIYEITITTIILGFVNTKMIKNEFKNSKSFLIDDPNKIANSIIKAVDKKKELYFPYKWKLIMLIINLIPENIFKKLNF
tara:strand:- start:59 stop:790 length:732 start_codon:yes stop_codon:yes gene_type:complete